MFYYYIPPNVDRRDWTSSLLGRMGEKYWLVDIVAIDLYKLLAYPTPGPCSRVLFLLELSDTEREGEFDSLRHAERALLAS